MKKNGIISRFMSAAFTLSVMLSVVMSCNKEPGLSGNSETVPLDLEPPSIKATISSKASIDGDNFPYSHTPYQVGLWLMLPGNKVTPQIRGFDNLKAEFLFADGMNKWTYYPFGIEKEGETSLHILRQRSVDLYAYHPWVSGVDDITRIPFVSGEDDWMIAVPVHLSEEDTAGPLTRTLEFQHLMTCLEVRIQCKYEGSITLTSMTLTDSKGRLVASGTFDCTSTDLSSAVTGESANTIVVSPKRSLRGGYWQSVYIIMPPVSGLDLSDNEMKLSFIFNNIEAETEFYLPPIMNVGGINQTITAFQRGHKYIYNLTLDNTMDFRPVGVEQQWTNEIISLPI